MKSTIRLITLLMVISVTATLTRAVGDGPAGEGPVLEVPDEIPADGSRDVTEELMTFIDEVPDGATIVFPESAEYRIEGTIALSDRHGVTVEGNGAVFRSRDKVTEGGGRAVRNRAHWRVHNGSSDIVLRDIHVIGPHEHGGTGDDAWDADREAQHAFDIDGAERVVLDGVHGEHIFGDGAYVRSDHVVVRNSTFHNTGRGGVSVTVARDVLIENNELRDIRRGIFIVETYGRDWAVDDIRIINNRTGAGRLLWLPIGGSGSVGTVFVAGNVMEDVTLNPTVYNVAPEGAGRRGPFIVIDNRLRMGPDAWRPGGVRIERVDGMLFAGNELTLDPDADADMPAIVAIDSRGAILGNRVGGGATAAEVSDDSRIFLGKNDDRADVEMLDIDGGHAARAQAGEHGVIALWRSGGDGAARGEELAAFEVSTDADAVIIVLDAEGGVVHHDVVGDGTVRVGGREIDVSE